MTSSAKGASDIVAAWQNQGSGVGNLPSAADSYWEHQHRLLPGIDKPLAVQPQECACVKAGVHLCTEHGNKVRTFRNIVYRYVKEAFHKRNLVTRQIFLDRKAFLHLSWSAETMEGEQEIMNEGIEDVVVRVPS